MPAYPDPITVFVVDDHTLFRRGLMALIGQDAGLQVIGDASDASEALRQVPQLQPQVILLDNHLPGVLGVDAIAGLCQASPTSRVVMLTVSEDGQDLATALRNGAQGYLLKTMDGELLFEAIRRAAGGEPVVSPELLGKLVTAFQSQGAPEPAAVAEGAVATVIRLSPTGLRHRIRFHPDGYWEQWGGIFGPSDRAQPALRWWRFADRIRAEGQDWAKLRPF